jgi:hypothetical protein
MRAPSFPVLLDSTGAIVLRTSYDENSIGLGAMHGRGAPWELAALGHLPLHRA